jgi:hypothetical protein
VILARLGLGHQRDLPLGDPPPILRQLIQFVEPALLSGVIPGKVFHFLDRRG